MNTPPRILIFKGGALGDFILWLPALALLRERWPAAYIELVGYPHIAGLARLGGWVDHVRSLDEAGTARLFSLRPQFPPEQVAWLTSFDLVVNYLYDPDGTVARNIEALGAPRPVCGNPIPASGHATDHLIAPLRQLAIFGTGREYAHLPLPPPPAPPAADLLIHPGSGNPAKNWPVARFLAAADHFRTLGVSVAFIIGEADEHTCAAAVAHAGWPVLRNRSVTQLAADLAGTRAYLGNDSGVTHLAAAVGVPTVALFGPTRPEQWAPRSPNVTVICRPADIAGIPVATVIATLGARLAGPPHDRSYGIAPGADMERQG